MRPPIFWLNIEAQLYLSTELNIKWYYTISEFKHHFDLKKWKSNLLFGEYLLLDWRYIYICSSQIQVWKKTSSIFEILLFCLRE